jgi:hypothetical protein
MTNFQTIEKKIRKSINKRNIDNLKTTAKDLRGQTQQWDWTLST